MHLNESSRQISQFALIRLQCRGFGSQALTRSNQTKANIQSVLFLEVYHTFQSDLLGEKGVSTYEKKFLVTEHVGQSPNPSGS